MLELKVEDGQKIVENFFKRPADTKRVFPTFFGVIVYKKWNEGVLLKRSIVFDVSKDKVVEEDRIIITDEERLKDLIEKLKEKKVKEII